jgi:hypothetical protein
MLDPNWTIGHDAVDSVGVELAGDGIVVPHRTQPCSALLHRSCSGERRSESRVVADSGRTDDHRAAGGSQSSQMQVVIVQTREHRPVTCVELWLAARALQPVADGRDTT